MTVDLNMTTNESKKKQSTGVAGCERLLQTSKFILSYETFEVECFSFELILYLQPQT